jgi:hypothetical protein
MKTPAAAPIAGDVAAKTERKGWFAHLMDALVEARMRQARREIERYLAIAAPDDLRKNYAGKFGAYDDVGVRFMR